MNDRERAYFVVAGHLDNLKSIVDALYRDPMNVKFNPQLCHAGSQAFFNLSQFLQEIKTIAESPS